MGIVVSSGDGVAEVVIDFPPVNALPVQGWFDLAAAVTAAGADRDVRAVVVAANGRGFCAGVDIKEIQGSPGHDALIGANRGSPCTSARYRSSQQCTGSAWAAGSAWPAVPTS